MIKTTWAFSTAVIGGVLKAIGVITVCKYIYKYWDGTKKEEQS